MSAISNGLKEITESEAPHLHATVERLCRKAGVAKPTLCEPRYDQTIGMMFDHLIGAMHFDHPRIVLGEQARKIFAHPNLNSQVSPELEAVLAHELSHLKHADVRLYKILPLRLSPFMGLAAGIAGLALYERIKKTEPQQSSEEDKKRELNHQLDAEINKTHKAHPELASAIKIIKYTAAAAFGFIAGSVVCKLLHNHMEFRADKFSAELMGSGKPLAKALTTFKTYAEQLMPEGAKFNAIEKYIEWVMHPDIDRRIARLNSM